jgi:hypothetical protein
MSTTIIPASRGFRVVTFSASFPVKEDDVMSFPVENHLVTQPVIAWMVEVDADGDVDLPIPVTPNGAAPVGRHAWTFTCVVDRNGACGGERPGWGIPAWADHVRREWRWLLRKEAASKKEEAEEAAEEEAAEFARRHKAESSVWKSTAGRTSPYGART